MARIDDSSTRVSATHTGTNDGSLIEAQLPRADEKLGPFITSGVADVSGLLGISIDSRLASACER
jgi:hypothetical protein